jgi:hypothetical protein
MNGPEFRLSRQGAMPDRLWRLSGTLVICLCMLCMLCMAAEGWAAPAADPALEAGLEAIRAVDHEGRGNAAAGTAWNVVAAADAGALPRILAAMDGANPLAAGWLLAAVDQIVARHPRLDPEPLCAFLDNTRHEPRARRLAFDLVAGIDGPRAEKLLGGLLDDPSVELRHDAVAQLMAQAEEAKSSGNTSLALEQFQTAFAAARDIAQVKDLAASIRGLGGEVDLPRHLGFLMNWQAIGPFDNTGGKGFAAEYPPERAVDLSATLAGQEGPVHWQVLTTRDEFGLVDINPLYPPAPAEAASRAADDAGGKEGRKEVVAYAVTSYDSPRGGPAELRLGTKNAWKIWLNGQLVFEREEYHRGMDVDQYRLPVALQQGPNVILIKLCQDAQRKPWTTEWQFQLRVCDSIGTAFPAGSQQAEPPPPAVENIR